MAVSMKMTVFLDVALCSLTETSQHFSCLVTDDGIPPTS
jgi:hypothetical protein